MRPRGRRPSWLAPLLAVPPRSAAERARALEPLAEQRGNAEAELVGHRLGEWELETLDGGAPIAPQACLRERGQFVRERLGGLPRRASRHQTIDEAHLQRLGRRD